MKSVRLVLLALSVESLSVLNLVSWVRIATVLASAQQVLVPMSVFLQESVSMKPTVLGECSHSSLEPLHS